MRALYPIMADLHGRHCLVVGGGAVAERKIAGLLETGAVVGVVSPDVTERIAAWETEGRLTVKRREYEPGDVEGAFLVFAATDRSVINDRVRQEAEASGRLVNVADDPEGCSFVVPAVLRSGPLLTAVSTSGTNPMASSRIRDRIADALGDGIGDFLAFAAEYRQRALERVSDPAARKRLLAELFGDEALESVRRGDWEALRERMEIKLVQERVERHAPE